MEVKPPGNKRSIDPLKNQGKQVNNEYYACYKKTHRVRLIKRDKEPDPRCHKSDEDGNYYCITGLFSQSLSDCCRRHHQCENKKNPYNLNGDRCRNRYQKHENYTEQQCRQSFCFCYIFIKRGK